MRIALASVQVPFIRGGAELLADRLRAALVRRGHEVELVTIPFKWYPPATLLDAMSMAEKVDLTEVNGEAIDRVLTLKFPAYLLSHPCKTVWLMHQHRQAFDLWGTPHGDLHAQVGGARIRRVILQKDRYALGEARGLFAISRKTAGRLRESVGLEAEVLYHPPPGHEHFACRARERFIFYPSRIDAMKRQQLLVRAARHLGSDIKIVLAGNGSREAVTGLEHDIERYGLGDRVRLLGVITEEEKIDLYSRCLAVYFGAYDEDYGYVTLEAFLSSKPVIVHPDAGGPLEFIEHGVNGHVVEAEPRALARTIDDVAADPAGARETGEAARRSIEALRLDWDHVVDRLLA